MNRNAIPRTNLDEKVKAIKYLRDRYKPFIIVEGNSDFKIYSKLFKIMKFDRSQYDIVVSNGKTKTLSFHGEKLSKDIDYIAIIDSDFDIYYNRRIEDDKLVYTHFYDIENYLTTSEVIEQAIKYFEDSEDGELDTKKIVYGAIEDIYPFIVAIKYKLNFRNKYKDINYIYSIEDESILNEKFINNNKLNIDKIKEYIVENLKTNNIEFDQELWEKTLLEVKEDIKNEEYVHTIVKGRRLLEIYHDVFSRLFKDEMLKRNRDLFISDLRAHMEQSKFCIEFLKELEKKISIYIN